MKVNQGIPQPSSVDDEAVKKFVLKKRNTLCVSDYVNGILEGNRTILGRAITLVESSLQKHYIPSQKIIEQCIPHSGNSIRIGITGIPGVGKSTFIESFGKFLTSKGRKLAVLAVDPSSKISHGSILGDKTRMEELANDPHAFIRPSPSAGTLGGVARKTRESIILCEAAGFDIIIVETVGVGQSETAVNIMVDFFLLLMIAGAGDELQGIKRGIMEMADAIVINKADGENIKKAEAAKIVFQNALHLFPPSPSGWIPIAETCSSITNSGIEKVWEMILGYERFTKNNNYFFEKRQYQAKCRMTEMINERLKENFHQNADVANSEPLIEKKLLAQKISSYSAAQKLLDVYFRSLKK
ncbi:MAG: methylmalonyl Co-A mutase-associated GTPase MeaB [Bacteroidota bacterium]